MASDSLVEIIEKNHPGNIHWSLERIQELAKKAGFDILPPSKESLRDQEVAVNLLGDVPDLDHILVLSLTEDQVQWHGYVEGSKVVYNPYLIARREFRGNHDIPRGYMEAILLKVADIQPVTIGIEGDTVKLPLPTWVQTVTFPRGEARELAEEYIRQLAELVGFEVTLKPKQ